MILSALLGAFFGLCLLKFGNPPIMEKYVEAPKNGFELLASAPWPLHWAYWILACLTALAITVTFLSPSLRAWVFGLHSFPRGGIIRISSFSLLLWLFWQFLSTCFSVRPALSHATVIHYTACVVCFSLGLFILSRLEDLWPLWLGILGGFVLVVAIGFDQHFGGLAESRAFFYHQQQLYPEKDLAPELLKKIASNRIYSTLFYPNTLAGALLLFAPAMLLATVQSGDRWRLGNASRSETVMVLIAASLACIVLYLLNTHAGWILILLLALSLVFPVPRWIAPTVLMLGVLAVLLWSGSKAGWLIMLLMGVVALLRVSIPTRTRETSNIQHPTSREVPNSKHQGTPVAESGHVSRFTFHVSRPLKSLIVAILLIAGLTGFFIRYSTFFRKGATSVSARFDYWRAAIQTTQAHPLLGTGPGTFQVPYEQIKRPEAEMARLVHNDYLEQASDSGLPGFLFYTVFIVGALVAGRPRPSISSSHSSFHFAIWLGLFGWAAQCLVEFSLQIPALAWPAFALLGYLCSIAARRSELGLETKPR